MKTTQKRKASVIKKAIKVDNIPVLIEAGREESGKKRRARVLLVQENEEGATIEVVCPCGEKIEIACEYEAKSTLE